MLSEHDFIGSRSLIDWEQHVNDRLGTAPAPPLSPSLLPESSAWLPMRWVRVDEHDVKAIFDSPEIARPLSAMVGDHDGGMLFPIHPLIESAFPPERVVSSGRFAVSASYRTVFYEPEGRGPFTGFAGDGECLMLKLHLDDLLPGIAGDRRLTPAKVNKCVSLSRVLPHALAQGGRAHRLEVIREQVGLIYGERGVLVRAVPRCTAIPLFSFYSRDDRVPGSVPIIVKCLDQLAGGPARAAGALGEWLAEPLFEAVLAGFREGFSLELHAQNTLVVPDPDRLIGRLLFRDLESVVFFPDYRSQRRCPDLALDSADPELVQHPRKPNRWFNRNMDHDVGRILYWTLAVLEREGYFGRKELRTARASIRSTARRLIEQFDLEPLARQGRWLPYSRSPYGTGRRPGHYYRTMFR